MVYCNVMYGKVGLFLADVCMSRRWQGWGIVGDGG